MLSLRPFHPGFLTVEALPHRANQDIPGAKTREGKERYKEYLGHYLNKVLNLYEIPLSAPWKKPAKAMEAVVGRTERTG